MEEVGLCRGFKLFFLLFVASGKLFILKGKFFPAPPSFLPTPLTLRNIKIIP